MHSWGLENKAKSERLSRASIRFSRVRRNDSSARLEHSEDELGPSAFFIRLPWQDDLANGVATSEKSGMVRRKLESLQACRGIAAMLVVLFHASGTIGSEKYGARTVFGDFFS